MEAYDVLKERFHRLALLIKKCRENRKLSLEQASNLTGISKSAIHRMESEQISDSQNRWLKLLEAYKPTPSEIELMHFAAYQDDNIEFTAEEIELIKLWRANSAEDRDWWRKNMGAVMEMVQKINAG